MKRAIISAALVCSVATFARADDASGDPSLTDTLTEQAKGAVNAAVSSAADGAREGADRVTKAASDKAGQVADQATEAARKAADAAGEKARDAAAYGKDMADRVASGTKDQLHALGGRMGGVWEKCKDLFFAALAGIRDLTRTALLSAANALDESNALARTEQRTDRWDDVKSRFAFEGDRPSAAVSDELREHEFRVARLLRAREIADAADDARSVKRSDRLLETEYARHHDKLEALSEEEKHIEDEP